jgi:hypothetical protein
VDRKFEGTRVIACFVFSNGKGKRRNDGFGGSCRLLIIIKINHATIASVVPSRVS